MLTQKALLDQCIHSRGFEQPEPMPSTKLEAFKKEFGWIWKHAPSYSDVGRVYVSRIEPSILASRPMCLDFGYRKPVYFLEKIWLLNEDGEVVTADIKEVAYRHRYILWGEKICHVRKRHAEGYVHRTKTIADVLGDLGEKADSVRFVLSYFEATATAIVYKAPKGVSVPEWIRQQIETEKAIIQTTCAKIDAEAATTS